ncbi:MAG: exodeoxyribonuclease I [Rubrivivax sp.]|nr:exodeoxyribonuclease I [Rubrivivax sp.]
MVATTFFWHDYETFGRVPRRDRPAQFAGLRTDAELNIIGEPVMLHCRPAPDFLPDPESCLLTGILPQHCLQHGGPEHAFAATIERELGAPGTIGVGYNSIRFDDEVTRHLFWRNLIDPYAREWQNGCSRWDLLDTLRCFWALRPDGIQWPRHDDGRASFKLEHLTAANDLVHEAAHDALSDVRATIAVARLLRGQNARLWDFCLKLRDKNAVRDEIGEGRPFLHLSGMYPVERGCLALVWPLAAHPTNRNELVVWDLAQDPRELESLDAETVRRRLYTRADDLPEGEQRLPIKTIHVNKSPIVVSNRKVIEAAAERWGIDLAAAERHAGHAAMLNRPALWTEVFRREAAAQPPDVDEDLYGGFVGNEDRRTLERLRGLPPQALAERRPAFEDGRLDELLFRYRARNFADTLNDEDRARWQRHCADRLHRGAGGATTLAQYFQAIDDLAESADDAQQAILEALYDYGQDIAPEDGA